MIQLRITNYPHEQYDEVEYLVKQIPAIITPIDDPEYPSSETRTVKLIELDLPESVMAQALELLGYLGWEVELVKYSIGQNREWVLSKINEEEVKPKTADMLHDDAMAQVFHRKDELGRWEMYLLLDDNYPDLQPLDRVKLQIRKSE